MAYLTNPNIQRCEQRLAYPYGLVLYFALTQGGKPIDVPPVPGLPGSTVSIDGISFSEPLAVDGYVVFSQYGTLITVGNFERPFLMDRFTRVSHHLTDEDKKSASPGYMSPNPAYVIRDLPCSGGIRFENEVLVVD